MLTPEARGIPRALKPIGPLLAVKAGEVRLDIEANPLASGAPVPPEQFLPIIEEAHRLALSVAKHR